MLLNMHRDFADLTRLVELKAKVEHEIAIHDYIQEIVEKNASREDRRFFIETFVGENSPELNYIFVGGDEPLSRLDPDSKLVAVAKEADSFNRSKSRYSSLSHNEAEEVDPYHRSSVYTNKKYVEVSDLQRGVDQELHIGGNSENLSVGDFEYEIDNSRDRSAEKYGYAGGERGKGKNEDSRAERKGANLEYDGYAEGRRDYSAEKGGQDYEFHGITEEGLEYDVADKNNDYEYDGKVATREELSGGHKRGEYKYDRKSDEKRGRDTEKKKSRYDYSKGDGARNKGNEADYAYGNYERSPGRGGNRKNGKGNYGYDDNARQKHEHKYGGYDDNAKRKHEHKNGGYDDNARRKHEHKNGGYVGVNVGGEPGRARGRDRSADKYEFALDVSGDEEKDCRKEIAELEREKQLLKSRVTRLEIEISESEMAHRRRDLHKRALNKHFNPEKYSLIQILQDKELAIGTLEKKYDRLFAEYNQFLHKGGLDQEVLRTNVDSEAHNFAEQTLTKSMMGFSRWHRSDKNFGRSVAY